MKNKRLIIILLSAFILLIIPYIAMQFDSGVNWNIFDFIVIGILLCSTGLLIEITIRKFNNIKTRVIICFSILFLFFLIWAELAVGIIGTPFAGS